MPTLVGTRRFGRSGAALGPVALPVSPVASMWADTLAGADGALIATLAGAGITLTAPGSGPTLSRTALNGRPGLWFTGAATRLRGTFATPVTAPFTVFAVLRPQQSYVPATTGCFFNGLDSGGGPTFGLFQRDPTQPVTPGDELTFYSGGAFLTAGRDNTHGYAAAQPGRSQIVEVVVNGASSSMTIDGFEYPAATLTNPAASVDLLLGTESSLSYNANHILGFIGIWPGVLSAADRAAVRDSLADYYRITVSALQTGEGTVPADGVLFRQVTPPAFSTDRPCRVVFWSHGAGESRVDLTDPCRVPMLNALTRAGYVVYMSDASGNNFGNAASQTNWLNLKNLAAGAFRVEQFYFLGYSMGALDCLSMLADNTNWPDVTGAYVGVPICSLAAAFGGNAGQFAPEIRAAYGIASDGSDYAAKTSGFDPLLLAANAYAGKRVRLFASPDDVVVPMVDHATPFRARFKGSALECTLKLGKGNHGGGMTLPDPADVVNFFARC